MQGAAEHYHFIIIKISTILYEYMSICLLVCKTTSKQDYNSISLNVYKPSCLPVYMYIRLQK